MNAMQFDGTKASAEKICEWANAFDVEDIWVDYTYMYGDKSEKIDDLLVFTESGEVQVYPGDWVVKSEDNTFYVSKEQPGAHEI